MGGEALTVVLPFVAGLSLLIILSKFYDRGRRYEIIVQLLSGFAVGAWFLVPFPPNHWWFDFSTGALLGFLVATLCLVPVRWLVRHRAKRAA